MKDKWFFPATNIAFDKLKDMFDNIRCDYQVVAKDRVLEQWTVFPKEDGSKFKQVLVNIIKRQKGFTILISELTLIASD